MPEYARAQATTDDPIRRKNNKHDWYCAYNGCPKEGNLLRVTASGGAVLYCTEHHNKARLTFDK